MPTMTLLPGGFSVGDALVLISDIENANIVSSSTTQIVFTTATNFIGTFTLTGTGLSTTVIGGVEYINGGTVAGILINEGGTDLHDFTDLALSGVALRNATRADREGTNQIALETLFRGLTYTINGRSVADSHTVATSFEAVSLALTRNNTYDLGDGNDTVTAAGSGGDTIY